MLWCHITKDFICIYISTYSFAKTHYCDRNRNNQYWEFAITTFKGKLIAYWDFGICERQLFDSQTGNTNQAHSLLASLLIWVFLFPNNCLSILRSRKMVAQRNKKEIMKTKTHVIVLGCLCLVIINTAAVSNKSCKKYKSLKVDFAVLYTSTKILAIQKGYQCFTHCSAEKNCVVVITTKNVERGFWFLSDSVVW